MSHRDHWRPETAYQDVKPEEWPKHSEFGASNAERWLNCPGSYSLCQTVPDGPSSKYAEEGTRAHALAESLLRSRSDGTLERTQHDTEMVDHCLAYVALCQEQLAAFDQSPAPQFRIEHRVIIDAGLKMFGTADFLATGYKTFTPSGLIVDLKYGKGKRVKAEANPQLAYYAVALRRQSKLCLKQVRVVVFQPRIPNGLTVIDYNTKQLDEWSEVFLRGAEKALWQHVLQKQEYTPGQHCFWCPAKGVCPTQAEKRVAEFSEMCEP